MFRKIQEKIYLFKRMDMFDLENIDGLEIDILIGLESEKKGKAPIDYENPQEVANLVACHLGHIFWPPLSGKLMKNLRD
jgi:hypothetical protein